MQWDNVPTLTALFTAVGAAVLAVYDRWARRAERREDRVIENLQRERDNAIRERDRALASASRWRRLAVLYHALLLRHDIEPVPAMELGGDDE